MERPPAELPAPLSRALAALLPLGSAALLCSPRWLGTSDVSALVLAAALPVVVTLVLALPFTFALAGGRSVAPPSAALVVGGVFSLCLPAIGFTGGASSPLAFVPLAVGVTAGAVLRPRMLGVVLPACLGALVLSLYAAGAPPGVLLVQAFLLAGFSMLGRALLFGAVSAAGQRADARVDVELLRWYDDARLFRLLGAQSALDEHAADGDPHEGAYDKAHPGEQKRLIGSAEAVRDGLYRLLRLGHGALSSQAGFVYLTDPTGEQLCLKEQLVDVDDTCKERLSARTGPLSLAIKKKRPLRLCDPQSEDLSNHRGGVVRSLIAVPLMDRAGPIGVLGFDRHSARPFSDRDESTLLALAEEMVHLMRTERLLHGLDEERKEKARVFTAARAFGGVVKREEAVRVALKTLQKVAPARATAFIEVIKVSGRDHVVVRGALGDGAEVFSSADVSEPEGAPLDVETWVGRAITQGALLPHTPLSQAGVRRGVLLRTDERALGFGDVRAIPLFAQGERIGALVVASPENVRFTRSHLDSIGVVADLAGVAFAGAGYYETLEKAATTDGLTGLFNRRTLNERFAEAVARAERTGNPLSVILGDVDHFKSVNDTYGHQVGDDVLIGVARTLLRCARVTDIVARYGGEEFVLVCEHTDGSGGAHLAERIRRSIAALRFDTDIGPLEVTSSFGVAALGDNGDDAASVLKSADEALYRAKEKGRNRVVISPPRERGREPRDPPGEQERSDGQVRAGV